jgi:alpha-D-xyloside xylohydrolase
MNIEGETVHYDATNPEARQYLWDIAKRSYYDKGVKTFWLDEVGATYLDHKPQVHDIDLSIGRTR